MKVSAAINIIKTSLADDGIYRSDTFLLDAYNEGHKLVAMLTLFDERRVKLNIDGTRNFNALPTSTSAECLAPVYLANSHTGVRISPTQVAQLELYSTKWEGQVGVENSEYYALLNPYHHAYTTIILCPIQNIGRTQLDMIGVFVPVDLTTSDEPRLQEDFQDILFNYVRFYAFTSEPGRSEDVLIEYKNFVKRLNELSAFIKARFPSGRDYEPQPVEFVYDVVTQKEQQPPEPKPQEQ